MKKQNIKNGFENNGFKMYYQPILDSDNINIYSFESLIRWEQDGNVLLPLHFLDKIENDKELSYLLSDFTLSEAIKFAQKNNIKVGVNLNTKQLSDFKILDIIDKNIQDYSNNNFYIEITETQPIETEKKTYKIIEEIQKRGIVLALDDFGCGYSTISLLKDLPINILKIDRKFSHKYENKKHDIIMKGIMDIASKLKLDVVIEGIEDIGMFNYAFKNKFKGIQGFHISKAVPEIEAKKMMLINKMTRFQRNKILYPLAKDLITELNYK